MSNRTECLRISGQREGFALAGALLAMVVVGALVTGSFFAASQEQAIGLTARYNDTAMYVAEFGVNQAMASVPRSVLDTLTGTKTITDFAPVGPNGQSLGVDTVWVRPFGNLRVFVSKGVARTGGDRRIVGGRRVLAVVTRTLNMSFPMDRAVQIYAGIKVGGSSVISGKDTFPDTLSAAFTQWKGCDSTGLHSSVVAKDTSLVDKINPASKIIGPVTQDTSLNENSFFKYGDGNYDLLASMANITHEGDWNPKPQPMKDAFGNCLTSNTENWGEPGATGSSIPLVPTCRDYFPVIHVKGSLNINSNGRGQGILLVDGDLNITGGFEFWGITVIKGKLATQGTGGHLYGTVMAYDMGLLEYDENAALGNSVVSLSTCAIKRAVENAPGFNRAVPLRMHSWMDLTATGAGF